jgi:hypothetical protein
MCYDASEQLQEHRFDQAADIINSYFDTHNIF